MRREEILITADMFELGDDVAIGKTDTEAWPYNYGVVTHIDAKNVTIRRPYMHHANFKHSTGDGSSVGVITYIGVSEHTLDRQRSGLHRVIRRVGELR